MDCRHCKNHRWRQIKQSRNQNLRLSNGKLNKPERLRNTQAKPIKPPRGTRGTTNRTTSQHLTQKSHNTNHYGTRINKHQQLTSKGVGTVVFAGPAVVAAAAAPTVFAGVLVVLVPVVAVVPAVAVDVVAVEVFAGVAVVDVAAFVSVAVDVVFAGEAVVAVAVFAPAVVVVAVDAVFAGDCVVCVPAPAFAGVAVDVAVAVAVVLALVFVFADTGVKPRGLAAPVVAVAGVSVAGVVIAAVVAAVVVAVVAPLTTPVLMLINEPRLSCVFSAVAAVVGAAEIADASCSDLQTNTRTHTTHGAQTRHRHT